MSGQNSESQVKPEAARPRLGGHPPLKLACPGCGREHSQQAKFCTHCRQKLDGKTEGRCPQCGSELELGDKFCRQCRCEVRSKVPAEPRVDSDVATPPRPISAPDVERQDLHLSRDERLVPSRLDVTALAKRLERSVQRDLASAAERQQLLEAEANAERARLDEEQRLKARLASLSSENDQLGGRLEETKQELGKTQGALERQISENLAKEAELQALRAKNQAIYRQNADVEKRYRELLEEKRRLETSGKRPLWRCNVCRNLHTEPSECVNPGLGGHWEF